MPLSSSVGACSICGDAIDKNHLSAGVCAKAACRVRASGEVAQRVRESLEREDIRRRARAAARRKICRPTEFPIHRIPSQREPMVPTTELRRKAFRRHLESVVSLSFESPDPASPHPESGPAVTGPAFGDACSAACRLCKGSCCQQGAEGNAFLTTETIAKFRRMRPTATAQEIVDDYIGRMPTRTFRGSCVFHGIAGCTLPRDLRSRTCNEFLCPEIQDFRGAQGAQVAPAAFFIVRLPRGRQSGRFVGPVPAERDP